MAALAISDLKKFLSVYRKYRLTPIWTRHIVIWSRPERGALRNVTKRGAGCGGRGCDARRAALEADGEGVWSWRPDAGAKFSQGIIPAKVTVAKEPGHRGEHV